MKKEHRSPRTRSVLAATGLLLLGIAPFGVAATGDPLREGKRNGTATRETEIISNNAASTASKGGYSTRQSNLSNSGGGAIYGCRSTGGTNRNPCLRGNNLSTGLAFEFNATNGSTTGTITAGGGGDSKKPFTTNATGVATGLNADRVDGKSASEIVSDAQAGTRTRFVLINAAGQIEQQSGGFTVKSAYEGNPPGAEANVYIDSGEDLTNNGISGIIALQNADDQNGDGVMNGRADGDDNNPEFSGEIAATRCAIPGVVTCAPPGTNTNTHFVVSPRLSNGERTNTTNRKRFYITITE